MRRELHALLLRRRMRCSCGAFVTSHCGMISIVWVGELLRCTLALPSYAARFACAALAAAHVLFAAPSWHALRSRFAWGASTRRDCAASSAGGRYTQRDLRFDHRTTGRIHMHRRPNHTQACAYTCTRIACTYTCTHASQTSSHTHTHRTCAHSIIAIHAHVCLRTRICINAYTTSKQCMHLGCT